MAETLADLLDELLEPMGGVSIKRMFGGLGIFRDGMMFGMVMDDTVYFRADDTTKAAYEAEGCASFSYLAKSGRLMEMPYWRVPERLLDDGEALRLWAGEAVTASRRAKADKPGQPATRRKKEASGGRAGS